MAGMVTTAELREAFRAIPKERRDDRQSFAIRVWRSLSWLERAEQAADVDEQFIALWIGFNALYGRLDDDNHVYGDRQSWRWFLPTIWELDQEGLLRRLLGKRQLMVLKLIDNKYLSEKFWADPNRNREQEMKRQLSQHMARFGTTKMLPILMDLFERIYIMRLQVIHGAATKGSKLNRRTMIHCAALLREFLPTMLDIMIRNGIDANWGRVCFPPST